MASPVMFLLKKYRYKIHFISQTDKHEKYKLSSLKKQDKSIRMICNIKQLILLKQKELISNKFYLAEKAKVGLSSIA